MAPLLHCHWRPAVTRIQLSLLSPRSKFRAVSRQSWDKALGELLVPGKLMGLNHVLANFPQICP